MSIEKKFVIIDEIMDQLEAAKSGVVPGSVSQSVVSGIQNVPSSIVQPNVGGGGAGAYTTFPLSPIVKNCCLDKTYLNFEFDINYNFAVELADDAVTDKTYKIPFWFGMRDTSSMFNQIQVLIENTSIWSTVYQREESVVAYNSLPETEIRGNNQYASIEKMKEAKYSPMKRIIVEFKGVASGAAEGNGNINNGTKTGSKDINMHFKCTVDINRITPLLSNLHYTTPHMGNLRLKVFMQEFEKCLFFCPDYGYYAFNKASATLNTSGGNTYSDNAVNAAIASAIDASICQPLQNQYWSFYPLNAFWNEDIDGTKIPFYYISDDAKRLNIAAKIKFSKSVNGIDGKGTDFMTFKDGIAEIVQTNFEIKGEEYERLTNYFASTGSIIIPTQTWSTSVFNGSPVMKGENWHTTMVGNIGGYNINFVTLFFHPDRTPCYFSNEYLTNFQLILDGRPVNAIPYEYMNDKCIVDMTQAIIDTDHEEINHSFMDSMTFLNETDTKNYIKASASTLYGTGALDRSINKASLRNPGTCMYNFSTNLPDAFHSGACILENSNRQAVIRLTSGSAKEINPAMSTDRDKFPYFLNSVTNNVTCGFTCLCDACIVLNFDASRNCCFDGALSWSAPFVE